MPSYFSGRKEEVAAASEMLRTLQAGQAPASDWIVYGPRGNGKTCLLTKIEQEAGRMNIRTLATTSAEIDDVESLIRELRRYRLGWQIGGVKINVFGVGATIQRQPRDADRLLHALERATEQPLAIFIDEVHRLNPKVGARLLSAGQEIGRRNRPLLLTLAGTPDMLSHLRSMEATFVERSLIQPLHLLGKEEAKEALRRPFEEQGWRIAEHLLEEIAEDSQGYPYFVQIWGDALWKSLPCGEERPLTDAEDIAQAREQVRERKDVFYQGRQEELEARNLKQAAVAIARAYQKTTALTRAEADGAIAEALGRERPVGAGDKAHVDNIRQALQDEGYFWAPRGQRTEKGLGAYVPGIPSLMHCLLENESAGHTPT